MPKLLMCDPANFGVSYEINPWMAHQVGMVQPAVAAGQWNALANILGELADIAVMPSVEGWPDLIFTANAGLVIPQAKRVVLSSFRHPERQGEAPHYRAWFEANGWVCDPLPGGVVFEGAGDALFDSTGRLWVGVGPRTDQRAVMALSLVAGGPVQGIRLTHPSFYHLDTCFCPLPRGYALLNPRAVDQVSWDFLKYTFRERLLCLTPDEADLFCANAVAVGETVVMNQSTPRLRAVLRDAGFLVQDCPLTEFMKAGGSAKCLTLALD